ncbi:MAG: hypothetical protein ABRQ37_17175 [Candidatus Eremiobacterota bacterium]
MINLIEPFKKNPLFLDLKGKFLSSVVSSLPGRKIEGFLLLNKGEKLYVFFLKDRGWASGFSWYNNQIISVDVRDIETLCTGEDASASFYQSQVELLDIILDRVKDPVLLTKAACVNSSILTFLIEEAERDGTSAYFKLEWKTGQKAYILVKEGTIIQRVFIDKDIIAGDDAGQKIITTIEVSPCDISLFELPSGGAEIYPPGVTRKEVTVPVKAEPRDFNRAEPRDFDRAEPRDFDRAEPRDFDRAEPRDFNRAEPRDFDRAEPRDFNRAEPRDFNKDRDEYIEDTFSTKVLSPDKLPKEDSKKKASNIFSAIFKRQSNEKKIEPKGQNIESYSFPLFNKKPTDKIIKTVSDVPVHTGIGREAGGAIGRETGGSSDSFKDHVLKSYFSLAEGYEEDGNIKKACAALEEALEVPQIDRLSVYRYYLSVCRKNNLIDKELEILRKMALEYKGEAKILGWVNRQIAILYVKKGQTSATREHTEPVEIPLRLEEEDTSPRSFLARIFHKDNRKK